MLLAMFGHTPYYLVLIHNLLIYSIKMICTKKAVMEAAPTVTEAAPAVMEAASTVTETAPAVMVTRYKVL